MHIIIFPDSQYKPLHEQYFLYSPHFNFNARNIYLEIRLQFWNWIIDVTLYVNVRQSPTDTTHSTRDQHTVVSNTDISIQYVYNTMAPCLEKTMKPSFCKKRKAFQVERKHYYNCNVVSSRSLSWIIHIRSLKTNHLKPEMYKT